MPPSLGQNDNPSLKQGAHLNICNLPTPAICNAPCHIIRVILSGRSRVQPTTLTHVRLLYHSIVPDGHIDAPNEAPHMKLALLVLPG
jgi:hypothetical protein